MGTDVTIFANHTIDFSNKDITLIADDIKKLLDGSIIKNRTEIQDLVSRYYGWQGYDYELNDNWHKEIISWQDNAWHYTIDNDYDNYIQIDFYGPFHLEISFTNNHIEFNDPGYRYSTFFGIDKKDRNEWRKYYYQYISLFGGNYAIYLPDQGEVAEFTAKIWDYNINLDTIAKELIKKYGTNTTEIDDFPIDENDFVDPPYYFIDYFEDIKRTEK